MVVGKLLILLSCSNAVAEQIDNPKFFEYESSGFVDQLSTLTFGWFKTLDEEQSAAYNQAVTHAVMYAEHGQKVKWQQGNAYGLAVPVTTWPSNGGYCRRIYIHARAFNVGKELAATACFDGVSNKWQWHNDKY
jgi:surface antigen